MRADQSPNALAPRVYYVTRSPESIYSESNPMSVYQMYRYMYDKANGSPENVNEIAYRMGGANLSQYARHESYPIQAGSDNNWLRPPIGRPAPLPTAAMQMMYTA